MAYFDKDYAVFFSELEKNNTKEWFDGNRKRYERSIKNPFKSFMLASVEALQKVHPDNVSVPACTPYDVLMGSNSSSRLAE